MSVADIFLTFFAWSMCMIAKADDDLREFIERHEGGKATWKH